MDPVTTIITAVVAGAVAAGKDVAAQAVKDGYTGLKALIVRKFGEESDVADAVEGVEKKPDSKGRQETLKEELEAAQAGQDAELVGQARALLDLLKEHGVAPGPAYHAEVRGSGAIAQGPGAVAAGERGVAVGGDVQGGMVITGDGNVVGGGDVQTGGIRAGHIEADNVVDGVQMQGGDAETAAGLVDLARAIQRGGVSADEIKAGNLVSGLQYIADPTQATPDDLRREIAALRQQVEKAIAAGEIPDGADAEDAQDALGKAEAELSRPKPQGKRVVRKLDEVVEILTRSAEAARAGGKFGLQIIKLAPIAATLWRIAEKLWGG